MLGLNSNYNIDSFEESISFIPRMHTPYKYVVTSLPRSQSFWLSQFLNFDHDASADLLRGNWQPQSGGVCDTGLYLLSKEQQAELMAPDAKVIILCRSWRNVAYSFTSKFKQINHDRLYEWLEQCQSELMDWEGELASPPLIEHFPLRPAAVQRIQKHFFGHYTPFEDIAQALQTRHDKMAFPDYLDEIKQSAPFLFQ